MSYKYFVSPSTLKQTDKAKLLRWATEHHMPSEPGVAFERWLDALQGVGKDTKAKALALSREWNSDPAAATPHDLVAAEGRFGVLGLFVFAAAAILAAMQGAVQGRGEQGQAQTVDDGAERFRAEALRELLDEENVTVGAGDDSDTCVGCETLSNNTGRLLDKFNVDKLTQDEIEKIDTETSTQITDLVQTLAKDIVKIFDDVGQFNVQNTLDHMSPIIEHFFSETISQVVLKHNIRFLKELQTNLGKKILTTPSSYQKIENQLKPVIKKFVRDLGYTPKSSKTFANTIFKNVKTTFSSTETLNDWLDDANPEDMTTRLKALTRQHIMLKMANKKDANFDDLYSVAIIETVLGTTQLFQDVKEQEIFNQVDRQPSNAVAVAIIKQYVVNVNRVSKNLNKNLNGVSKKRAKALRLQLLGMAIDDYKQQTVSEVLNIARVLSPAILDKYHNNTLDVARDIVDRLKVVIKSRSGDGTITIPQEWFNLMSVGVIGLLLHYSGLMTSALKTVSDMASSALSKCRSVKCRSSDGSDVESDDSDAESDGADAESDGADAESGGSDGYGGESDGYGGESETRELPQPGEPIRDFKAYVLDDGKGNNKLWIEYGNDYRRITNRGHSDHYTLAQETKTKQRWYNKAHEVGRIDHKSIFQIKE